MRSSSISAPSGSVQHMARDRQFRSYVIAGFSQARQRGVTVVMVHENVEIPSHALRHVGSCRDRADDRPTDPLQNCSQIGPDVICRAFAQELGRAAGPGLLAPQRDRYEKAASLGRGKLAIGGDGGDCGRHLCELPGDVSPPPCWSDRGRCVRRLRAGGGWRRRGRWRRCPRPAS